MRRNFLFASLLFGLLFLATPAFAISYSSSFHLSDFSIGGISFNLTPIQQEVWTGVARSLATEVVNVDLSTTWPENHSLTSQIAQVGLAFAFANPTEFFVSHTLTEQGVFSGAQVARVGEVFANESGHLTISANYTFTTSGFPSGSTNFHADGGSLLCSFIGPCVSHLTTINSDLFKTGTISMTQYLNAGEGFQFLLLGRVQASIPTPNMLWPTLVGMVGIAFVAEVRRRQGISLGALKSL